MTGVRAVLDAAGELIPREGPLRMLAVGGDVGWRPEPGLPEHLELTELDPGASPDSLDGPFEIVLLAGALGSSPEAGRSRLAAAAWEAVTPGGWLVVLEDVVPDSADAAAAPPLRMAELEELVVAAGGGGAILEQFEALRHPGEDLHRAALLVCSKPSGLDDPVRLRGFPR
jgi:hypothetical protein